MGWRSVAASGIALIMLSACGAAHGDFNDSSAGPSPVVLKDTSAAQLSVIVALNVGGYDNTTRDRTLVDLMIQADGHPVRFVAGEKVACGEVALKGFTGSFEGSFATASIADRVMTCTYTSGQRSASLTFRVPKQLVILSPREHDQVPRGRSTIVSYTGSADPTIWVVALSKMHKAFAQPGASLTSATIDTSSFTADDGSIALADPNNIPLPDLQAGQFKSASGSAHRTTMVSVVWI
jgi:hypothetical protein